MMPEDFDRVLFLAGLSARADAAAAAARELEIWTRRDDGGDQRRRKANAIQADLTRMSREALREMEGLR